MPVQRESDINDFAFEYLRNHYIAQQGNSHVLVDRHEQTKQGYVSEGLFSFKGKDEKLFIASLHTHNSPKISRALTCYKKKGLSKLRYALFLLVLAGAFMAGWQVAQLALWIAIPAAVVLATACFVLHTLLEKRYRLHQLASLLDELKRTPADEQWLGLSMSSLTFRNNSLASHMLAMCERRGIGVIKIGRAHV